jgi:hypothetical protein
MYVHRRRKKRRKKDNFYAHLERVYDMAPNNNVKIVLGDTNAKFGQERAYYTIIVKPVCTKHLLRTANY